MIICEIPIQIPEHDKHCDSCKWHELQGTSGFCHLFVSHKKNRLEDCIAIAKSEKCTDECEIKLDNR